MLISMKKKCSPKEKELPSLDFHNYHPPLKEAKLRLISFIEQNRRLKKKVVKIIHGYGSHGVGGVLRVGLRRELVKMQTNNRIKCFIEGEELNPSSDNNRKILQDYPMIELDPKLKGFNEGITIVIIS